MGIHLITGANSAPADDRAVLDVEATATVDIGAPLYIEAETTADVDVTVDPNFDEPKLKLFIDPIDKSVHDYPDRPPPEDESPDKRSLSNLLFPRALTADQKEALRLHTVARQKKRVKALVWDTKLETEARAWARKIAKSGKLAHSAGKDRPNQGENLAYAW